MNKPAPALALSEGQRQTLQTLSRSTSAAHRLVVRSRALLLAGDGVANARIAAECGVAVSTVVGWRKRFAADGLREFLSLIHISEPTRLRRISYAVFCLKKKKKKKKKNKKNKKKKKKKKKKKNKKKKKKKTK